MEYTGIAHPERLQDPLLQDALVGLAGDFLDDRCEQIIVGIAVLKLASWKECQGLGENPRQDLLTRLRRAVFPVKVRCQRKIEDAGSVREQVMQGDRQPRRR